MGATELTGANLYATDLTDSWSSTTCPPALTATTKGMCARRSRRACEQQRRGCVLGVPDKRLGASRGHLRCPPARSRQTRSEWSSFRFPCPPPRCPQPRVRNRRFATCGAGRRPVAGRCPCRWDVRMSRSQLRGSQGTDRHGAPRQKPQHPVEKEKLAPLCFGC